MNTREIAQTTGKNERTVQRWTVRASDRMSSIADKMSASSPAKPADYSFDETLAIIEAGMGKNAAAIWRTNAQTDCKMPSIAGKIPEGNDYVQRGMELVFGAIGKLDERISRIESRVEERQALLPAPQMSRRDHINKLAREYATKTGVNFSESYSTLYREFGYRTRTNPSLSAKNRGMTIIDYIEAEGQIDTLEAVAMEVFK